MSNQQLIKSAHVWFLTGLLACGLMVIAGKAGIKIQEQNSNQNSNSNTSNANSSQNRNANANANRSANRNSANANTGNMNAGNMNATGGQAGISSRDREFLMDVAMDGLMEVELGRIAAQQGSSDAIKQFGQRMVDDHSKANTELTTLASSKGITLPTSIDDKHRGEITKLSAMSGADFDRAYAKMMLKAHEKDVSEFEKESNRGGDADIKAFAAKTLPTLQEHLQMARALPGNERGGGRNDNSSGGSRNSNSNSNRNRNGNMNGNGNANNSNRP